VARRQGPSSCPRPRRLLILNWRDTRHPEGGGSEVYVEEVAHRLSGKGYDVTLFSAQSPGSPRSEYRDGLHFVRRGGHLTVYLWAGVLQLLGRLGRPDIVLEVQNGMPFLARLYTRRPVVILIHHVHREQWPVVGPTLAKVGWFLESRIAPWVNRRCRYLAVSGATKMELARLGVSPERITLAHNGVPPAPRLDGVRRSATPRLVVLSRLVPHKQIEHAIDCLAALGSDFPDVTLVVIGSGWWHDELVTHAAARGVTERVVFAGHLDDLAKHRELARAWVHLMPSLKEGWGLSIIEAATHGTPSVAYYAAGGVQESIADRVTGLLATDFNDLVECVRSLLNDAEFRHDLGVKARLRSHDYHWHSTAQVIDDTLTAASRFR
jgi:glycosyltransferase involved in cell wall biosynthesis